MKKIISMILLLCVVGVSCFAIDFETVKKTIRAFVTSKDAVCVEVFNLEENEVYYFLKSGISYINVERNEVYIATVASSFKVDFKELTSIKYSDGILYINMRED